jgi:hypothetical protein
MLRPFFSDGALAPIPAVRDRNRLEFNPLLPFLVGPGAEGMRAHCLHSLSVRPALRLDPERPIRPL